MESGEELHHKRVGRGRHLLVGQLLPVLLRLPERREEQRGLGALDQRGVHSEPLRPRAGAVDRQGVPGPRHVDELREVLRQRVVERVLQQVHRLRVEHVCPVLHEVPLKEVQVGVLHRVPVERAS